jgi:hypothetical protein
MTPHCKIMIKLLRHMPKLKENIQLYESSFEQNIHLRSVWNSSTVSGIYLSTKWFKEVQTSFGLCIDMEKIWVKFLCLPECSVYFSWVGWGAHLQNVTSYSLRETTSSLCSHGISKFKPFPLQRHLQTHRLPQPRWHHLCHCSGG